MKPNPQNRWIPFILAAVAVALALLSLPINPAIGLIK